MTPSPRLPPPSAALLAAFAAAAMWALPCQAQFSLAPAPAPTPAASSDADSLPAYRLAAAKHIYAVFPLRVHKGRLPPLLYGIAIVEFDIDADGQVSDVRIVRKPAAPEVGPWVQSMIRRAAPFPAPIKLGRTTLKEIWLVRDTGQFQLDALTEGQD